jgi:hypothetical protein
VSQCIYRNEGEEKIHLLCQESNLGTLSNRAIVTVIAAVHHSVTDHESRMNIWPASLS